MREALSTVNHKIITKEAALELKNSRSDARLVAFIKDPIKRVNSLFAQLWDLALNNSGNNIVPEGTIKAYGGRIDGTVGLNEHHWNDEKRQAYLDAFVLKQTQYDNDADIIKALNNEDYIRYIDYRLANKGDEHWLPQTELCSLNGVFLPTIVHEFTEQNRINLDWAKYSDSELPILGHHKPISVDEYRLDDLNSYYVKDIEMLANVRAANGNWHSDS
jgi:hypothetical protein